jgi:hypothetical protein
MFGDWISNRPVAEGALSIIFVSAKIGLFMGLRRIIVGVFV